MAPPTLIDIREHIEDLASDAGRYYVVCARTGDRPVPAAGHRFPDRAAARAAARATERYRAALRRYDPRTPRHDLVVRRDARRGVSPRPGAARADRNTPGEHGSDDDTTGRG
jgi:hypothetical protein